MEANSSRFSAVQPGGSLILAWQIRGKRVLVVGGGEVASGRIVNCLNADAHVVVVAPRSGLVEEVAFRVKQNEVEYFDREFIPHDLDGADMVLTAVDSPTASTEIYKLCKERRISVNVADVPSECDFYFGSQHRDGPLQIMVSTNGNGPKLANLIRTRIAATLPENMGTSIANVGELRRRLRNRAPEKAAVANRMSWMISVCQTWTFDELAEMTPDTMDKLLEYYPNTDIPDYTELTDSRTQRQWTQEMMCIIC